MKKVYLLSGIVVASAALISGSYVGYSLYQRREDPSHLTPSTTDTPSYSSQGDKKDITISGNLQGQVPSGHTNTADNTSDQNPSVSKDTPANSTNNDAATTNPAEFKRYEKYATAQQGLFADLVIGTGAEAVVGKKLSVNYRGWLTNGSVFDQNANPNSPFVFTLGTGSVIPGWEQTIAGMKVGGERLIIIPPAAGYGNISQGPIPANSVLVFIVKLLKVE